MTKHHKILVKKQNIIALFFAKVMENTFLTAII